MRVLYEILAGHSGAMASYAQLLRALARRYPEDEYVIVCPEESGLGALGQAPNVSVRPIKITVHKELTRLWYELHGVGRIAHALKADVIWSTNVGPYVRTGIPQVLSVLNSFQVYPWSVVRYHPGSRVRVAMLRWFFRRSLAKCDAAMVETELLRAYVERVPNAPRRIGVIPKAVETDDDLAAKPLPAHVRQRLEQSADDRPFTFLYVATAAPHKNHRLLVAALERLRAAGVKARVAVSISEQELVRIAGPPAAELMRGGLLLPVGWIDKDYLRSLYDACDACVMPSLLECLSSAHLEAMHWEKPQVSADLPFGRDLCGDAALYAAAEDPDDWAEKMTALMRDESLRRRLVAAGKQRMQAYPQTWSEVAGKVRDFLAEVVADYPGQTRS